MKDGSSQGPAYDVKGGFDEATKGARFGKAARTQAMSSTPGPGAYVDDSSRMGPKASAGAGRIGSSKRKDPFTR